MTRRLVAVVVVAVAALVGALVLRATISPDALRLAIESRLAVWFGAPVTLAGAAEIRLLPTPRVRWADATLTRAGEPSPFVRAEAIEITLAPLGLLTGRDDVARLILRRPEMRLARPPLPSIDTLADRLAALPALDAAILDGRLDLVAADGSSERIEAIDLTLHRPGHGLADLALRAHRGGEPLSLEIEGPTDLAAEGSSRVRLALDAPGLSLRQSGAVETGSRRALAGSLAVDVTDADRFAAWIGAAHLDGLLAAPLHVDGTLRATPDGATLDDVTLGLGTARAAGALRLGRAADEAMVSGTLAFGAIDLTGATPLFGPGWRDLPLDRDGPALDLRLSASGLRTPFVAVDRIAATVHLIAGRLIAEVGEASLWERPLSLAVTGDFAADGFRGTLRAQGRDLPAAEIGALFAVAGVEAGTVVAGFEGETRCARLGDCVGAVAGRLQLAGRNLAITGNSPFGDVTRFHPIVVGPKTTPKKAIWSRADADVRLVGVEATVDQIDIVGDVARFGLRGTGNLADGTLDLAGHALFPNFRADPARSGSDTIRLPIRVHGAVHRLEITPAMPEAVPAPRPPPTTLPPALMPITPPPLAPTE